MTDQGLVALEITTREDRLRLRCEVMRCFSFALHQAGLPIAGPLRITHQGPRPAAEQIVRLTVPELDLIWDYRVPALDPGQTREVFAGDAWCDQDLLERIVAPRSGKATLSCQDASAGAEILICNTWQWPIAPEARMALGAYVMPNDGIVRRIHAALPLGQNPDDSVARGEDPPRLEESSGPSPSRAARICSWIERLFGHLQGGFDIRYAEALPVDHASGIRYQPLRPPHRLLRFADGPGGEGTCIDLALLLASCAEAAGWSPLILLLGSGRYSLTHALFGLWTRGGTRPRPIIRSKDLIIDEYERGNLMLIEATALCRGDRRRGFAEACSIARRHLDAYPHVEAVDIRALRPPRGRVLPLETPMEAAVLQALATAAQVARDTNTPLFETLHLLLGAVAARGTVTLALLHSLGVEAASLETLILAELRRHQRPERPGRTMGYDRCLADAREAARSQGSTVVRECDLWWAFFWGQSAAVKKVFQKVSVSWSRIENALQELCPQERPQTII